MTLQKSVSFWQAVIYGVGVIVGTGIYTLIGIGAGISGNLLWLSFIVAGIIATLTALSYAKLSSLFTKESAESFYAQQAFGSKKISFLIGFLSIIVWVFSAATVSWGLTAYTKAFISIEPIIIVLAAIIFISLINFVGIQLSVRINSILTIIAVTGLFGIIIFGLPYVGQVNLLEGIDGTTLLENSFSLGNSIFSAAALIFFAYLGFEGLANISEETRNPKKNIPKAILFSLLFVTILYVLISVIAVSAVPANELYNAAFSTSTSTGPLALVAEKVMFPGAAVLMTLIAFATIGSTLLVLLNVSSRILYGMSKQDLAPKIFGYINPKTNTPSIAVIITAIFACLFALIGNIELLGSLCTMSVFLLFGATNISLVYIQKKFSPFEERESILNKKNFVPLIAAAFCLLMLLTQYWETVLVFGIEVPLIGVLIITLLIGRFLYFLLIDRD